jgi:DNA-directed RNA polymerase III subunit RPC4
MDDKSRVKKEVNAPLGPPPPKRGLKFAPKVPVKKAAKLVPKKEPVEDSKDETINKELLMKLKASQVLIVVFGSSFVVSARFSLDALFIYTVFCFILQITDPFARRIKTEEKPKSRTQVAFGQGNSSYARSFLIPKSSSDEAKLPKEYAEPWVRKDQITNEDCFLFRSYPLVSFFFFITGLYPY